MKTTNEIREDAAPLQSYVAKYLSNGGTRCPICDSTEIESQGRGETDGDYSWQLIACLDCHSEWQDIYRLADVCIVEIGTK